MSRQAHEMRSLMDLSVDEHDDRHATALRVDLPPRPSQPPVPPRPTSVSPRPRPKREHTIPESPLAEPNNPPPAIPPRPLRLKPPVMSSADNLLLFSPEVKKATNSPFRLKDFDPLLYSPGDKQDSSTISTTTTAPAKKILNYNLSHHVAPFPSSSSQPNLQSLASASTSNITSHSAPRTPEKAGKYSQNRRLSDLMVCGGNWPSALDDEILEFDPLISKPGRILNQGFGMNGKPSTYDEETEDQCDEIQDPFCVASLTLLAQCRKPVVPPRNPIPTRPLPRSTSRDVGIDTPVPLRQGVALHKLVVKPKVESKTALMSIVKGDVVEDRETLSFCDMLKSLMTTFPTDDMNVNSGRIMARILDRSISPATSVKLIVDSSLSLEPVIFTCSTSTTIEHVVSHVVVSLQDGAGSSSRIEVSNYGLRVHSVSEYLQRKTTIGDYEYVQNCVKLDLDIRFQLIDLHREPRPLQRSAKDQESKLQIPSMRVLKPVPIITRDDISVLLEMYIREEERLLDSAMKSEFKSIQPRALLQATKAICTLLCNVETSHTQNASKRLLSFAEKGFSSTGTDTSSEFSSGLVMASSCYDELQQVLDELNDGILELVSMYARTFHTDFICREPTCLPGGDENSSTDISEILDSVVVHIAAAHRLPVECSNTNISTYEFYRVSCELFYGGRRLCPQVTTAQTKIDATGFHPKVVWDEWVQFSSVALCTVPRETRLTVTLLGFKMENTNENTAKLVKVPIGWAVVQLFDCDGVLAQGAQLLALWPDEFANPCGSTQDNILLPKCTLLQIDMPDYGCKVAFPEVIKTPVSPNKRAFETLHPSDQQERLDILEKDCISFCSQEENEMLWEKRQYLYELPEALPRMLLAAPSWDYACLSEIYNMLGEWKNMDPVQALELLLPCYPDLRVRHLAVRWIGTLPNDDIHDYLPQLVQALKYDQYHNSPLAKFLLEKSMSSSKIAHRLYWLLKEAGRDHYYQWRYYLMLEGLLYVIGQKFNDELQRQERLVLTLGRIAETLKAAKDREATLTRELAEVYEDLQEETLRLPHDCAVEVRGLDLKACSYFPSNALPLKVVFKNHHLKADPVSVMFKVGDDLRQDMLTLQFIHIMNNLWLKEGLDLKMIYFKCLPTGDKRGFVELISECETLRKIQVQAGLTGSFKDRPLAQWLQKYNPTELDYANAVKNFTRSCAGCCVATYILGVCDRHNDNIMLKQSGHMFHIDFGKFLGDSQMFGNIKRDRVPFVLTSDMAYVINAGDKPTRKFQEFIDLCCQAFNIIRKHDSFLLNLIRLMSTSGIPGVNHDGACYIKKALMPNCSDTEATAAFTRMIEGSLKSLSTQINFFIHNLAQMRFSGHTDNNLLSFIPKTYSVKTDGAISHAEITGYQKRYSPEKFYWYLIRVERHGENSDNHIARSYEEFHELYKKLLEAFPLMRIPSLPSRVFLGRSNAKNVAEKRIAQLNRFVSDILSLAPEISECELIYTFFHPILRDESIAGPNKSSQEQALVVSQAELVDHSSVNAVGGSLKLGLIYKDEALQIMVMHAKDLHLVNNELPDAYVKCYLLPDPSKQTKRKSRIVHASQHPTFNELLTYNLPVNLIKSRRLQITVWNYDALKENELMGAIYVGMSGLDLSRDHESWYKLGPLQQAFSHNPLV